MTDHLEFRSDERGGVVVMRDGHPQSYVDPDDPGLLVFEYVQHFATVLDLLPEGRLAVTHIGGAGLTLPRYVQHTRPGSPQIVLEPDAPLTDAVRRELPLPRGHRIRVRPVAGQDGLADLTDGAADAIAIDAFDAGMVPVPLVTTAAFAAYRRILAGHGVLLANIADRPDRKFLASVIATATTHFEHVLVITTTEVMKRKRFGNYVVVASAAPLPIDLLRRAIARAAFPTSLVDAAQTASWGRQGRVIDTADAIAPPPPDPGNFRLR
ncbi:spermidine synthase [Calidifontibacter terrae]